jgi:hypothetical protein
MGAQFFFLCVVLHVPGVGKGRAASPCIGASFKNLAGRSQFRERKPGAGAAKRTKSKEDVGKKADNVESAEVDPDVASGEPRRRGTSRCAEEGN